MIDIPERVTDLLHRDIKKLELKVQILRSKHQITLIDGNKHSSFTFLFLFTWTPPYDTVFIPEARGKFSLRFLDYFHIYENRHNVRSKPLDSVKNIILEIEDPELFKKSIYYIKRAITGWRLCRPSIKNMVRYRASQKRGLNARI